MAQVVRIATSTMFEKHYYTFWGKRYRQRRGGPIGLRGTSAVARFVLQIFDRKWEARLEKWAYKYGYGALYG